MGRFLVLAVFWLGPTLGTELDALSGARLDADAQIETPSGGAQEAFPASLVFPSDVPRIGEAEVLVPASPALSSRLRVVYWPGGEERARRVVEVLDRVPSPPGLPADVPGRAVIFLAPDPEVWDALTGGRVPDWGAGVTLPVLERAVIPLFESPGGGLTARDRTTLHEWAHLGLHQYLDGLAIPRWFDEGYAQVASGGWNVDEAWRLRLALARGGSPLDSLSLRWPMDRSSAELAYLLSASAVEYLFRESGLRGMEVFFARWREAGAFESAFRSAFGITSVGFERLWLEHVEQTYGWILVASRTAVFWLLAAVGLALLFRIRRRRDLERMARLRALEPPARPAYWESATQGVSGGDPTSRDRSGGEPWRSSKVDPPRGFP